MIKKHLELVILPCFCYAYEKLETDKQAKMNKLLDLWEKNKYFSDSIIGKLRDPTSSWHFYEDQLAQENAKISKAIEAEAQTQLETYERQNKEFTEHSTNQINYIQMQINQIIQQQIMVVILLHIR